MYTHLRAILFLVIASFICIAAVLTDKTGSTKPIRPAGENHSSENPLPKHPAGFVDGATNPALIPDNTAYTLLFRLLSNRNTEKEKGYVQAYIKQMEIENADALLAVVKKFESRIGAIDRKAKKIHEQKGPNFDDQALAQLNRLQEQKEEIVADIITSLPSQMGTEDSDRLRRHVNDRVKRKIKITPEHTHPSKR